MSDPERLLDSDGVDPQVRELLQSLRDVSPAGGAAAKSWGRMAAKVAAVPVLATASSSAAAHVGPAAATVARIGAGAWKTIGLKVAVGALASTVAGVGAVSLYSEHASHSSPRSPLETARAVTPARAAPVPVGEPPSPVTPRAAEKLSNTPAPAIPRHSALDEETSMLAKARNALRGGDARAAAGALSQLQSAFPGGQLVQERDVLTVEVLAAIGNVAAAKHKAQVFIAAHPTSPHSAKLRRFVDSR